MKIIRNFQVFVVLMLAFLCAGIGMNYTYAEDNNGYQDLSFNVGQEGEGVTDLSGVKGLDWDVKKGVLTMDGYNGELNITNNGKNKVDIEIVVKGENTLDGEGLGLVLVGVSATFKGEGTLNVCGKKSLIAIGFFNSKNNGITIDGPTINVLGGYQIPLYIESLKMISGTLNIEMCSIDTKNIGYAIYVNDKIELVGGTVIVNYMDKEGVEKVYPMIWVNNHNEVVEQPVAVIDNCAIFVVGDLSVTDKLELIGVTSEKYTVNLGDNFNFIKADSLDMISAIDISKFKPSLLETKFTYDGKAKTPKVKVGGLVEGKDFSVKYVDNIKPGTATAIITGKGFYGGEIKIDFVIEGKISEDGPKVGSKIKYLDYIYKVIKAGTTDGKETGEVALVGINNKKLKKIKVAKTVSINNVKYKVTQIGAKAFKKNKKIKSVVIGKNVKKIGKQAFFECKKLKKITIKSKKLKKKSIGAKAFKGIYKKAKFKVPKKKLKLYKKLIKKAKAPKKCKISK